MAGLASVQGQQARENSASRERNRFNENGRDTIPFHNKSQETFGMLRLAAATAQPLRFRRTSGKKN